MVLYIDADDETMTERLVNRGKTSGRVDDNLETIKSRLQTFHNQTEPVIAHYAHEHKVKRVSANGSAESIFAEIEKIFDEIHHQGIKTSSFKQKTHNFLIVIAI